MLICRRPFVYKILLAASLGLLCVSRPVNAEQVRISRINTVPEVIDQIIISERLECADITVRFNYPVQYLSHFPLKSGNQLEIKLSFPAVKESDKEIIFARESLMPPPDNRAALSRVNYEGDTAGGPFLVLYFTDTVAFKVKQGDDFRSLTITVSTDGSPADCLGFK